MDSKVLTILKNSVYMLDYIKNNIDDISRYVDDINSVADSSINTKKLDFDNVLSIFGMSRDIDESGRLDLLPFVTRRLRDKGLSTDRKFAESINNQLKNTLKIDIIKTSQDEKVKEIINEINSEIYHFRHWKKLNHVNVLNEINDWRLAHGLNIISKSDIMLYNSPTFDNYSIAQFGKIAKCVNIDPIKDEIGVYRTVSALANKLGYDVRAENSIKNAFGRETASNINLSKKSISINTTKLLETDIETQTERGYILCSMNILFNLAQTFGTKPFVSVLEENRNGVYGESTCQRYQNMSDFQKKAITALYSDVKAMVTAINLARLTFHDESVYNSVRLIYEYKIMQSLACFPNYLDSSIVITSITNQVENDWQRMCEMWNISTEDAINLSKTSGSIFDSTNIKTAISVPMVYHKEKESIQRSQYLNIETENDKINQGVNAERIKLLTLLKNLKKEDIILHEDETPVIVLTELNNLLDSIEQEQKHIEHSFYEKRNIPNVQQAYDRLEASKNVVNAHAKVINDYLDQENIDKNASKEQVENEVINLDNVTNTELHSRIKSSFTKIINKKVKLAIKNLQTDHLKIVSNSDKINTQQEAKEISMYVVNLKALFEEKDKEIFNKLYAINDKNPNMFSAVAALKRVLEKGYAAGLSKKFSEKAVDVKRANPKLTNEQVLQIVCKPLQNYLNQRLNEQQEIDLSMLNLQYGIDDSKEKTDAAKSIYAEYKIEKDYIKEDPLEYYLWYQILDQVNEIKDNYKNYRPKVSEFEDRISEFIDTIQTTETNAEVPHP